MHADHGALFTFWAFCQDSFCGPDFCDMIPLLRTSIRFGAHEHRLDRRHRRRHMLRQDRRPTFQYRSFQTSMRIRTPDLPSAVHAIPAVPKIARLPSIETQVATARA